MSNNDSLSNKIVLATKYIMQPGLLVYVLIYAIVLFLMIQTFNSFSEQMGSQMAIASGGAAEIMQDVMSGKITEAEGQALLEEALKNGKLNDFSQEVQFQPPASFGLLGVLASIFGILFMYKGMDSMKRIIEGEDEAPSYMPLTIMNWATPLKFIAVMFASMFLLMLIVGIIGIIPVLGVIVGMLLFLGYYALYPAMTPVMVKTESFRQTINPSSWIEYVRSMGIVRYALMCLVMFGVMLIPALIMSVSTANMMSGGLPKFSLIGGFLFALTSSFTGAFFFTFTGYMSRKEVEESDVASGVNNTVLRKGLNQDLQAADESWRNGRKDEATQLLAVRINNTQDWDVKMPLLNRLFYYFDEMGQPEKKTGFEYQMFERIATKDHDRFPMIHQTIKDKVSRGEKIQPQLIYPFGNLALINNDPELALKLTSGFAKAHPKHQDVPGNLFVAAKAFKDLRKPEQAYKILAHLIKTYPNDQEMPDFKALFADVKTKLKAKQAMAKARAEQNNTKKTDT